MNNKEIWKDVKGYEGLYQVSSKGRVKSLDRYRFRKDGTKRFVKGKILKPSHRKNKYLQLELHGSEIYVHRLVAQAFIPNPHNYPQVNHKDEDPSNNCVDNLEWCTPGYNNRYGTRMKRIIKSLSMKVVQLSFDGSLVKVWSSISDASKNGYYSSSISHCCQNRLLRCNGYYWIYYSDYKKMSKKDILKYVIKRDRRIVQLDLDDHIIKIWDSNHAADKAGFQEASIKRCCKGKQKKHAGYHWMFYKKILEKQLKEMG